MPSTDAAAVMKEIFTMNRMKESICSNGPFALADCFFHRPTQKKCAFEYDTYVVSNPAAAVLEVSHCDYQIKTKQM
jgi:hypothetical protein